jgi:hypothetical protein
MVHPFIFGMLTVYMNGNAFDKTNANQNVMVHSTNIPEEPTAGNNEIYIPLCAIVMAPLNYPSYVLAVITNATKSTFIRHIPRRRPKQQWCAPLIPTLDSNNYTTSPNLYPIADVSDPQDGYPPDQLQSNSNSPRCGMLWANSQVVPLRCLHIRGNLLLSLGDIMPVGVCV